MTREEGRAFSDIAPLRYTLRQGRKNRRNVWNRRIRLPTLLGILGCLCGATFLQQFNILRKLVPDNVGENRLLFAPFEDSKIWRHTNEHESLKILPVKQLAREVTGKNTDRQSGKIQENAILVFRFPNHSGQGTGNIMSGALAAQLLAEEFNRTLCHTGAESTSVHASFRKAFDWIDDHHQDFCDRMVAQNEETVIAVAPKTSKTIEQRNYDQTSEQSECEMREMLSNHAEYPIMYYEGNTYPRWPNKAVALPRDYFHELFKPTQALRDVLPWKESAPPQTIVHLRDGDDERDVRGGLDDLTLSLLAKSDFLENSDSQRGVFLVTNNVEWYSRFPEWSHPDWSSVHHSALRRISWGRTPGGIKDRNSDGELQMWSDWYTLLNAQKIYHTFSDFSRSVSRWNENIQSWTILGSTDQRSDMEDGKAEARILLRNDIQNLTNKSDIGISRLVDRKSNELWFCGSPSPEEQKHMQEKKDRQLLNLLQARKRRGAAVFQNSNNNPPVVFS